MPMLDASNDSGFIVAASWKWQEYTASRTLKIIVRKSADDAVRRAQGTWRPNGRCCNGFSGDQALHCTADSLPSGIAALSCCARSPVLSSGLGCCGGSLISFQDVSTSLESGKGPIDFHSHGRPSLRDLRRPQSTSPITVRRSGVYDWQAEVRLVRGAAK